MTSCLRTQNCCCWNKLPTKKRELFQLSSASALWFLPKFHQGKERRKRLWHSNSICSIKLVKFSEHPKSSQSEINLPKLCRTQTSKRERKNGQHLYILALWKPTLPLFTTKPEFYDFWVLFFIKKEEKKSSFFLNFLLSWSMFWINNKLNVKFRSEEFWSCDLRTKYLPFFPKMHASQAQKSCLP